MLANDDPNSPYYWNPNQNKSGRRMTIVNIDCGKYEGEVDSNGLRKNVGECKWDDGSYYRGDWA